MQLTDIIKNILLKEGNIDPKKDPNFLIFINIWTKNKRELLDKETFESRLNFLNLIYKNTIFKFKSEGISGNQQYKDVGLSSGRYDDINKKILIGVSNSNQFKNSFSSLKNLNIFFTFLINMVGHEIIHKKQYENISSITLNKYFDKYSKYSLEDYFLDNHEMMSHAYNIIKELRNAKISRKEVQEYLRNPYDIDDYEIMSISHKFTNYLSILKKFKDNKIKKELLKKFFQYLYSYNEKM